VNGSRPVFHFVDQVVDASVVDACEANGLDVAEEELLVGMIEGKDLMCCAVTS